MAQIVTSLNGGDIKITSGSWTMNQGSGGSFSGGQYRVQLHSAGPQKHSNTQCWLLRWKAARDFIQAAWDGLPPLFDAKDDRIARQRSVRPSISRNTPP